MRWVKKNRLSLSLWGITLICLLIYELRPQEKPLLPHATRIMELSGKTPFYWWLTDEAVLRFRNPAQQDWTFVRNDLKTKAETGLTTLTQFYQKSGGKP